MIAAGYNRDKTIPYNRDWIGECRFVTQGLQNYSTSKILKTSGILRRIIIWHSKEICFFTCVFWMNFSASFYLRKKEKHSAFFNFTKDCFQHYLILQKIVFNIIWFYERLFSTLFSFTIDCFQHYLVLR